MLRRVFVHGTRRMRGVVVALASVAVLSAVGCAGFSGNALNLLQTSLFTQFVGNTQTVPTTTTTTDTTSGGFFGGGGRQNVDPCEESNARKFITISMQNASEDYIHYFLALIAFVDTPNRPGAVCMDDIGIYTDFGYDFIPEGSQREFGDYCITGPALLYFHENGAFKKGAGNDPSSFGSAIPPAQGNSPTFDGFFSSAGALVPVPDQILFHNPGTGEGAALSIAPITANPCSATLTLNVGQCNLDAFYYVDEFDLPAGSTALGPGSARRVPNEIQDTGCTTGFQEAFHRLAPSGATASSATDNEFLRGGRIEYKFIREDTNPPIPQLLWRVTDIGGGLVHDFDPRAPR